MIFFWKSWQNKFSKQKHSPIIDGSSDGHVVVDKFADYFKSVCSTDPSASCTTSQQSIVDYTSQRVQCKLFSVETVDKSSPENYLALSPLFVDIDLLVPLEAEFYALSPRTFS